MKTVKIILNPNQKPVIEKCKAKQRMLDLTTEPFWVSRLRSLSSACCLWLKFHSKSHSTFPAISCFSGTEIWLSSAWKWTEMLFFQRRNPRGRSTGRRKEAQDAWHNRKIKDKKSEMGFSSSYFLSDRNVNSNSEHLSPVDCHCLPSKNHTSTIFMKIVWAIIL